LLDDLWGRILVIPSHAMRAFVDESNVPACKGLFLIMVAYVLVGLGLAGRRRTMGRPPLLRRGACGWPDWLRFSARSRRTWRCPITCKSWS
jgi:hypothetical protein